MKLPQKLARLLPALALALAIGCGGANEADATDAEGATVEEAAGQPAPGAQQAVPGRPTPPGQQTPPAQQTPPGEQTPPEGQTPPAQQQPVDLSATGHDEGDPQGSVVRVIEFSDFGCVHCANFHMNAYPELHEEFIDAGDVIWKYIPITIGGFPNGDVAAVAGECAAEQDRFASMRDRLFELRDEWLQSDDPTERFVDEAGELGLDPEAFHGCLTGNGEARARIEENDRLAMGIGVRATPTFIVQGHPVEGAPPLGAFQEVLRELVAEARDPVR